MHVLNQGTGTGRVAGLTLMGWIRCGFNLEISARNGLGSVQSRCGWVQVCEIGPMQDSVPRCLKIKHRTCHVGQINFKTLKFFYGVNCGQLLVQMLRLTVG